jgi:hypothetical protein
MKMLAVIAPPIARTGDQLSETSLPPINQRSANKVNPPIAPRRMPLTILNRGSLDGVFVKTRNVMYAVTPAPARPASSDR